MWASDADRLIEMANRDRWSIENRQSAASAAFDALKTGGPGAEYDAQLAALRDGYTGVQVGRQLRRFLNKYSSASRSAATVHLVSTAARIAHQGGGQESRAWNSPEHVRFVINAWQDGDEFIGQHKELRPQTTYPNIYQGIFALDQLTPSEIDAIVVTPGVVGLVIHTPTFQFSVNALINGSPTGIPCGSAYRHDVELFVVDMDAKQVVARLPALHGGSPPTRSKDCYYMGSMPESILDHFETEL
jgi:hypothetical protein